MRNRICPTEEQLAEYISGKIPPEKRELIESHLVKCAACREAVADASYIINNPDIKTLLTKAISKAKQHFWLISCVTTLVLSFIFRQYFFQFLAASLLSGAKSIIDSRATKMLIMIDRAIKDSSSETIRTRHDLFKDL